MYVFVDVYICIYAYITLHMDPSTHLESIYDLSDDKYRQVYERDQVPWPFSLCESTPHMRMIFSSSLCEFVSVVVGWGIVNIVWR